jgi:hypothetical protein
MINDIGVIYNPYLRKCEVQFRGVIGKLRHIFQSSDEKFYVIHPHNPDIGIEVELVYITYCYLVVRYKDTENPENNSEVFWNSNGSEAANIFIAHTDAEFNQYSEMLSAKTAKKYENKK